MVTAKKPLRVVFLHLDLGIGGAEQLVLQLAHASFNAGHDLELVTTRCDANHCFASVAPGGHLHENLRVWGRWIPQDTMGRGRAFCSTVRRVRDEMNSHQNRWIDVAYRQDDDAVVIIESKSGVSSSYSTAANKFFDNAIKLAGKHSTITWIAVFACFYDPDNSSLELPSANVPTNLTMKVVTISQDQSSFLGDVFMIAKQSDEEQVGYKDKSV